MHVHSSHSFAFLSLPLWIALSIRLVVLLVQILLVFPYSSLVPSGLHLPFLFLPDPLVSSCLRTSAPKCLTIIETWSLWWRLRHAVESLLCSLQLCSSIASGALSAWLLYDFPVLSVPLMDDGIGSRHPNCGRRQWLKSIPRHSTWTPIPPSSFRVMTTFPAAFLTLLIGCSTARSTLWAPSSPDRSAESLLPLHPPSSYSSIHALPWVGFRFQSLAVLAPSSALGPPVIFLSSSFLCDVAEPLLTSPPPLWPVVFPRSLRKRTGSTACQPIRWTYLVVSVASPLWFCWVARLASAQGLAPKPASAPTIASPIPVFHLAVVESELHVVAFPAPEW